MDRKASEDTGKADWGRGMFELPPDDSDEFAPLPPCGREQTDEVLAMRKSPQTSTNPRLRPRSLLEVRSRRSTATSRRFSMPAFLSRRQARCFPMTRCTSISR